MEEWILEHAFSVVSLKLGKVCDVRGKCPDINNATINSAIKVCCYDFIVFGTSREGEANEAKGKACS